MRRPTSAAGRRLFKAQNDALKRASIERGQSLLWSEAEEVALERAGETVDRAEAVKAILDGELAGESRPAVVVKLSGELRLLDKLVVDLVARLNPDGVGPVKSPRHQRAAHSRWDRTKGAS